MRLINKSAVRSLLLDSAKQLRPANKFRRVSSDTLLKLNEVVRAAAVGHVKSFPSKGVTL
jgi:hypothetical protein